MAPVDSGPRFDWQPTADEVAAIVAEMRPIIAADAERQRRHS